MQGGAQNQLEMNSAALGKRLGTTLCVPDPPDIYCGEKQTRVVFRKREGPQVLKENTVLRS